MNYVLITGSSRGIGLGLTKRYLERGDFVFATCRRPDEAAELQQLAEQYPGQIEIPKLNVAKVPQINEVHQIVETTAGKLDILINNAGVEAKDDTLANLDLDNLKWLMHINAFSPPVIARAFLDLLRKSDNPRIVNISSSSGSLAYRTSGNDSYTYSASKAALNMYTRALAGDPATDGITVIALDPGWVRTDMGGSHADLSVEESTSGIVQVIEALKADQNGSFLNYDGSVHPW